MCIRDRYSAVVVRTSNALKALVSSEQISFKVQKHRSTQCPCDSCDTCLFDVNLSAVGDESLWLLACCCVQFSSQLIQVEVIDLFNDGTGLGFGIVGTKDSGVVIMTIVANSVSARVCIVLLVFYLRCWVRLGSWPMRVLGIDTL